jgi:hypothetical protein
MQISGNFDAYIHNVSKNARGTEEEMQISGIFNDSLYTVGKMTGGRNADVRHLQRQLTMYLSVWAWRLGDGERRNQ